MLPGSDARGAREAPGGRGKPMSGWSPSVRALFAGSNAVYFGAVLLSILLMDQPRMRLPGAALGTLVLLPVFFLAAPAFERHPGKAYLVTGTGAALLLWLAVIAFTLASEGARSGSPGYSMAMNSLFAVFFSIPALLSVLPPYLALILFLRMTADS